MKASKSMQENPNQSILFECDRRKKQKKTDPKLPEAWTTPLQPTKNKRSALKKTQPKSSSSRPAFKPKRNH